MLVLAIELLVAGGLVGLLALAWVGGKLLARRLSRKLGTNPQMGIVQGAILTLLGLQLGFSFAGAMSRFVERQDIITREANTIGTLYLRAGLLDDARRDRLRADLRDYTAARLRLFETEGMMLEGDINAELDSINRGIWEVIAEGVKERPQVAVLVVPACNEMIDTLATRNAAITRHIPLLVLFVLIACAVASVAAIGLGVEASDNRLRMPAAVLTFLIAATLWTIIDLDFPRLGLIRSSQKPLRDVAKMMQQDVPVHPVQAPR